MGSFEAMIEGDNPVGSFEAMIEGENQEDVKDAIALMPTIPIRQMLRGFYEAVYGKLQYHLGNASDRLANAAQGET